jgi:3-vinyl bacteriochlorophyllide hydratase
VVKTFMLYTIMVTGAIWERTVFGRYLFAPSFFWEDVVSMAVIALHTAYLFALFRGGMDPDRQMLLALAAYTAYVINATQFVLKLRSARRAGAWPSPGELPAGRAGHVGIARATRGNLVGAGK